MGRLGVSGARKESHKLNGLSRPPGRRGASPRRGRVAGPDASGGKARQIYALVVRGARAGVRGATQLVGREPPPFTIGIRPEFRGWPSGSGFGKTGSSLPEVLRAAESRLRVSIVDPTAVGHPGTGQPEVTVRSGQVRSGQVRLHAASRSQPEARTR
jgi:hypothetical protein